MLSTYFHNAIYKACLWLATIWIICLDRRKKNLIQDFDRNTQKAFFFFFEAQAEEVNCFEKVNKFCSQRYFPALQNRNSRRLQESPASSALRQWLCHGQVFCISVEKPTVFGLVGMEYGTSAYSDVRMFGFFKEAHLEAMYLFEYFVENI